MISVDKIEEATYQTEEGIITIEAIFDGMATFIDEDGVLTHNALKNIAPSLIRKIG